MGIQILLQCSIDGMDTVLENTFLDAYGVEIRRKPLRLSLKLKRRLWIRLVRTKRKIEEPALNLMKDEKMDFDERVICLMRYGEVTNKAKGPTKDSRRADIPNGLRNIIEEF